MRLLLRSLVPRVYQPCVGVTAYLRRASVTARAALARGRGDGAAPARPRALAEILQRFLDQQDTERGPVSDVVASGSKWPRPGKRGTTARHVRRDKAALFQRVQAPP